MLRGSVSVAVVLAAARIASAGPWCAPDAGVAPAGSTLPVHPRVVMFFGDTFYAGEVKRRAGAAKVTATIDGKKVPIAIKTTRVGNQIIETIEIKSDKTGVLVVKAGKDDETTWTVSKEWTAPEKVNATVSRYHRDRMLEHHAWYDGARLTLDQPALTLRAKWRRDATDKWRTVVVPVMSEHDLVAERDGEKKPETFALLGQVRCGEATVPVELLEKGIELEATVLLANGKEVPVAGLANPLVLEKRKANPREDDADPLGL